MTYQLNSPVREVFERMVARSQTVPLSRLRVEGAVSIHLVDLLMAMHFERIVRPVQREKCSVYSWDTIKPVEIQNRGQSEACELYLAWWAFPSDLLNGTVYEPQLQRGDITTYRSKELRSWLPREAYWAEECAIVVTEDLTLAGS